MKLWTGRFSKETDARVNDFNSSIRFDSRMYAQDIEGSIAHAKMLCAQGIIEPEDCEAILSGLGEIKAELECGKLTFPSDAEDIHTFIEQTLTARVGDAGKRLHTGRSRNDQVALDLRLYLRDEIPRTVSLITELVRTLCDVAEKNVGTVMPGYTHLQRAQPITFGHHLMAYVFMLLRDCQRLCDCLGRTKISPLGSGALAGTTYPLDRAAVAESLGLEGITENSLDGVSDRDFAMELLGALSIVMVHLSRFSEEIILWSSFEFKFIELDDGFATGSSIMPQKKNPDVAELVRGKSGRVFGDLTALLTAMKGLPLAYNKDMQEDKEAVFDALDTVNLCVSTFTPMIATMTVIPENMRAAAAKGFINATDCADYLVSKGLPFRDAYKITGAAVAMCVRENKTLEGLTLEEYRSFSPVFDEDVYAAVALETCLAGRRLAGGPAPEAVKEQIAKARKELEKYEA
ncbi:MAG: argininosuccinate lyase [Clostridia bacterium]|nr:argininosuccinate lyase [Clostridia bacterium]